MAWHNELEDVWGRHNQRNEMVKIKQKANKNTTRKKKKQFTTKSFVHKNVNSFPKKIPKKLLENYQEIGVN